MSNHIVPNWIAQWLGYQAAGSGQGMVWTLDSAWRWPAWVTLLFVILTLVFVAASYWREATTVSRFFRWLLVVCRYLAIGLVLLMLAELSLSLSRTGLPTVVVLVDDSASMGIADRYTDDQLRSALEERLQSLELTELSRFNLARSVLADPQQNLLAEIEARYQLKFYWMGPSLRGEQAPAAQMPEVLGTHQPDGTASRLGDSIRAALADLRGTPPAALIVLTDGVVTDGESLADAAKLARRKGVPVFAVGLGSEAAIKDLELRDLLVDEVVFADDLVTFEATLIASGYAGKPIDVILREKNQTKVLGKTRVVPNEAVERLKVVVPYRPTELGEFEFEVQVVPKPDEASPDNNSLSRVVSVRKEEIRVLLVQAYPNFEFRYLKHMLERDTTIKLNTLLQDADLDYAAQDTSAIRTFPLKREELFEYDVLILGDMNPQFLSATLMKHIAEFVEEKGGGVAFIAGPWYMPTAYVNTPLSPLFPCDPASVVVPPADVPQTAGFRMVPTDIGLASPPMQLGDDEAQTREIWKHLAPLYWLMESTSWKPAARVLAEHPTQVGADGRKLPVICLQYFGAGKVLWHSTDETWRWRYRVGDVFFARYWVQAIRFLSRSKLLGKDRAALLTVDRREYRRGESVNLRARFLDERQAPADDRGVTVVVELAGQPKRRLTLARTSTARGLFEGTLDNVTEGTYHAWIATPTLEGQAPATDFTVVAPPGEFERTTLDADALRQLASETRGKYYSVATSNRLESDLPKGKQVPIEELPPHVLWNQWWMLAAFLSVLVTEWVLRKRLGLL
jgi:hypothetical protein